MTEREFYDAIGGNYAEARDRLMQDALIRRFVRKFPDDPNFALLGAAVADGRWDEAFAAAHTLKGVALNLAFARLSHAATALTDALRPQNRDALDAAQIAVLFRAVQADYATVCAAIAALDA